MFQLLSPDNIWHWFIAAAILLIIELISGGGYLLWIGCSAFITGLLLLLFPHLGWAFQLIFFAAFAILFAFSWWLYLKRSPLKTDRPQLNRRNEQYIGRVFTLTFPIIDGQGKLEVDDTQWRIQCEEDLPVGTKVKVIRAEGVVLWVEKANL